MNGREPPKLREMGNEKDFSQCYVVEGQKWPRDHVLGIKIPGLHDKCVLYIGIPLRARENLHISCSENPSSPRRFVGMLAKRWGVESLMDCHHCDGQGNSIYLRIQIKEDKRRCTFSGRR
jgi:hypothetical protein